MKSLSTFLLALFGTMPAVWADDGVWMPKWTKGYNGVHGWIVRSVGFAIRPQ